MRALVQVLKLHCPQCNELVTGANYIPGSVYTAMDGKHFVSEMGAQPPADMRWVERTHLPEMDHFIVEPCRHHLTRDEARALRAEIETQTKERDQSCNFKGGVE